MTYLDFLAFVVDNILNGRSYAVLVDVVLAFGLLYNKRSSHEDFINAAHRL